MWRFDTSKKKSENFCPRVYINGICTIYAESTGSYAERSDEGRFDSCIELTSHQPPHHNRKPNKICSYVDFVSFCFAHIWKSRDVYAHADQR